MNAAIIFFILFSVAALAVILWFLAKPLPEELSLRPDSKIEDLVPVHTQHFPQLKQTLHASDAFYVRDKAAPDLQKKWREERRRILFAFVAGLAEDFAKMDRMGRMVASVSPKLSFQRERSRLWLTMRFRLNVRIAKLWIFAVGTGPRVRLTYLTSLLGELSARTESAMTRLEANPS